MAKQTKNKTIT